MISIRWILDIIACILLISSYFFKKNKNKDYLKLTAIALLIINFIVSNILWSNSLKLKNTSIKHKNSEILSHYFYALLNSNHYIYLNMLDIISENLRLLSCCFSVNDVSLGSWYFSSRSAKSYVVYEQSPVLKSVCPYR